MKHEINEIWEAKEGKRTVWKLQAPRGILTCKTRKEAEAWQNAYRNSLNKGELQ